MSYSNSHLPENQAQTGWIYVIRSNVGGLVKIGITTNVERRMSELDPAEIVCLKEVLNPRGIEKELHETYSHCRLSGTEYFELSEYEIELIKERVLGTESNMGSEEHEDQDDRPPLLPYSKQDGINVAKVVFEWLKELAQQKAKQCDLKVSGNFIGAAEMDSQIKEKERRYELIYEIVSHWGRLDEDGNEGVYYEITEGMIVASELLEQTINAYDKDFNNPILEDFFLHNQAEKLRYAKKAREEHRSRC